MAISRLLTIGHRYMGQPQKMPQTVILCFSGAEASDVSVNQRGTSTHQPHDVCVCVCRVRTSYTASRRLNWPNSFVWGLIYGTQLLFIGWGPDLFTVFLSVDESSMEVRCWT